MEISKLFQEKHKKSLERILSDEGTELRMNRNIQAEGAFAEVKQDMGGSVVSSAEESRTYWQNVSY